MNRSLPRILCVLLLVPLLAGCGLEPLWTHPEAAFGDVILSTEDYPLFSDAKSLSNYLNEQVEQGRHLINFRYEGDLDTQNIARMIGKIYVVMRDHRGGCWQLQVTEYPGDRIARAYLFGGTETLTEDERAALATAEEVLRQARENTADEFELELYLHDWICRHVRYSNAGALLWDPAQELPRHLTALGALLDGEANCQGYVDGLCLLLTMAGFRTGRMSVDSADAGHVVNTLCLEGNWYIVDATYNDQLEGDEGFISHRLFNVGADLCTDYTWTPELAYHDIAEHSGDACYLYRYDCVFQDIDALADRALQSWIEDGRADQEYLLRGQHPDSAAMNAAIEARVKSANISCGWRMAVTPTGDGTVYFLQFSER